MNRPLLSTSLRSLAIPLGLALALALAGCGDVTYPWTGNTERYEVRPDSLHFRVSLSEATASGASPSPLHVVLYSQPNDFGFLIQSSGAIWSVSPNPATPAVDGVWGFDVYPVPPSQLGVGTFAGELRFLPCADQCSVMLDSPPPLVVAVTYESPPDRGSEPAGREALDSERVTQEDRTMKTSLAVAALLAASPALAGEGPPPGATKVKLAVGERLELCGERALLTCPVTRFICDDPKVATVELGTAGKPAVLVGVGPGQTTCAVFGFEGSGRRILEVAVARSAGK